MITGITQKSNISKDNTSPGEKTPGLKYCLCNRLSCYLHFIPSVSWFFLDKFVSFRYFHFICRIIISYTQFFCEADLKISFFRKICISKKLFDIHYCAPLLSLTFVPVVIHIRTTPLISTENPTKQDRYLYEALLFLNTLSNTVSFAADSGLSRITILNSSNPCLNASTTSGENCVPDPSTISL